MNSSKLKLSICEAVNKALIESLSISSDVCRVSELISRYITDDFNKQQIKKESSLNYKENSFIFDLFGLSYKITYKVFTNAEDHSDIFYGITDINEKTIELNLCYQNGKKSIVNFDDIIYHEVLHVFQYTKNKKDYLEIKQYKDLYDSIYDVLSTNLNNSTISLFAHALYISFEFEQDAMAHGLYGKLKDCNYSILEIVFKNSDEYQYLLDMQVAIDRIDDYVYSNKFGLSKNECLNRLQIEFKRYLTKLGKVYQKIKDEKKPEGLIHYIHKR